MSNGNEENLDLQINLSSDNQESKHNDSTPIINTTGQLTGAIPKSINLEKQNTGKKQNQFLLATLNKTEKSIYKNLNNNKISCLLCRKLITGMLNEKSRTNTKESAIEHLNSNHNIKITAGKSQAPPISENELTWDNNGQNFYQMVVTSQDNLSNNNFPPLPPPGGVPMDLENDIRPSNNDVFKLAKHLSKKKIPALNKQGITTHNRYQPLTDSEGEEEQENLENTENSPSVTKRPKATPTNKRTSTGGKANNPNDNREVNKKMRPPPLIIQGSINNNCIVIDP